MAKQRFIFPGKFAMRVVNKGTTLAYFTFVDTESGLEYRDFRLLTGKTGPFVGSPFRTYEKDGQTKFFDYVRASYDETSKERNENGVSWFDELTQAALAEYNARGGDGQGSSASKSSGSSSRANAGSKRSGRGPVPPTVNDGASNDEDDDLPF